MNSWTGKLWSWEVRKNTCFTGKSTCQHRCYGIN